MPCLQNPVNGFRSPTGKQGSVVVQQCAGEFAASRSSPAVARALRAQFSWAAESSASSSGQASLAASDQHLDLGASRKRPGNRQPDRHRGPAPDRARHPDPATVLVDDLVSQRKAQADAHAALLGTEAGLKELVEVRRRDTVAGVGDADEDVPAVAADAEGKHARTLHGVYGVGEDLPEG